MRRGARRIATRDDVARTRAAYRLRDLLMRRIDAVLANERLIEPGSAGDTFDRVVARLQRDTAAR